MKFFTKRRIIILCIIILLVIGFIVFGGGKKEAQMVTVERGPVVQEILVTGKTKALSEVELGFDSTGRVARSYTKVGDYVKEGQIIAELDISSELADLAKEKAMLAEERASLGGESESLHSAISEAYAAADNAVRNKTDQFFKTPRTNPFFEVTFTDGNYVHYFPVPSDTTIELNNNRKTIESMLTLWQSELPKINSTNAGSYADIAVSRLNTITAFLNKVAYAVNSFTPADFVYESTVTGYKTAVDSARISVDSSRSNLISAKEKFSPQAGITSTSADARIAQREASIANIEAMIRKARIVAPFSGTITQQDAKVGAVVTAGTEVVSLISENQMYIEANVSEVNIGKIKVGDPVSITFDAFPDVVYQGQVTYIEPGETLVDGVVNYKTRITLVGVDENIRQGLTVNLEIETARKENVLSIPAYSVTYHEGKAYVQKIVDRKSVKTEVETGLLGSDGSIEILSGLSQGDTVEFVLQ